MIAGLTLDQQMLRQIWIDVERTARAVAKLSEWKTATGFGPVSFWPETPEATVDSRIAAMVERPAPEETARLIGWTWEIPK